MHFRRLPKEEDITFKGEVKAPKKACYQKEQRRDLLLHLESADEEAKDANFKILSATLADGSDANLDYTHLQLGDNTLSYTPQEPGTPTLTIKVAVEGHADSEQTFQCSIEAPAANWQVEGRDDGAGNIALEIKDVPADLQDAQWRITETTWSEGLQGAIEHRPAALNYGDNPMRITLTQAVLSAPHVRFTIQGPDEITVTCQVDLTALCVAQLASTLVGRERTLVERLIHVAQYQQETKAAYQIPQATVNDPRVNREKQSEVETKLGQLEAFQRQYQKDLSEFTGDLATLNQTQVNEHFPVLRNNDNKLIEAIASLKSTQVQLQQQCTTAHQALFKTIDNNNYEAIETLLEDPKLNIKAKDDEGCTALHRAVERSNNIEIIRMLSEAGADVNARDNDGETVFHLASRSYNNAEMIRMLLDKGADVNARDDYRKTALQYAEKLLDNDSTIRMLKAANAR